MSLTKRHYESQRENLIESGSDCVSDLDLMYNDWLQSQEYQKLVESGELVPVSVKQKEFCDLPF
jgi:hypothetical protein